MDRWTSLLTNVMLSLNPTSCVTVTVIVGVAWGDIMSVSDIGTMKGLAEGQD